MTIAQITKRHTVQPCLFVFVKPEEERYVEARLGFPDKRIVLLHELFRVRRMVRNFKTASPKSREAAMYRIIDVVEELRELQRS